METVLIIEDSRPMQRTLQRLFESDSLGVRIASDGEEGLESFRHEPPNVVVLDLKLPGLSGKELCRSFKTEMPSVPIVILSANADVDDKVVLLELGADDYVTKPFSPKELVARVRAVLRRVESPVPASDTIHAADVTLDVPRMRVRAGARDIELTATEFQLLVTLAREPGRVFTRSQLLDAVHGVAFESYERAIDAHVKNIRRKLEVEPSEPRYLQTVHGVGYRFRDDDR